MYIIETFKGPVKIDADEIQKLKDNGKAPLIFFRQGAVNPKHIVRIIEDTERKADVLKMAGESEDERQQRILEERSEDIFAGVRGLEVPALNAAPAYRLKT